MIIFTISYKVTLFKVYAKTCVVVVCSTNQKNSHYNKYYRIKLTAARLKKGTAHWFILANSARIFINLSWCDYIL